MSKKSKRKKLKKKFKQLLKQKLAEQESQSLSQPKISQVQTAPKQILVAPKISKSDKSKKEAEHAPNQPQTLTNILNPYVKPDLIRIGIYLSIFIIILIAASVINQKTTWLTSLASQVFSLLHLG